MDNKKLVSIGNKSSLDLLPVENETIKLTVDTEQLFFDILNKRIEISDFVRDYTEDQIKNLSNPKTNKYYVSSDTNRLFIYDSTNNEFVCKATDLNGTAKITKLNDDSEMDFGALDIDC